MKPITKWLVRTALGVVSILLSLLLLLYYAFGYRPKREAQKAIAEFHQRLNKGDVVQDCRNDIGYASDKCLASMMEIQDLLGKFKSVKSSKIRCEAGPVFFCLASYVSSFEKGETRESLTLKTGSTGQYQLFEYSVVIDGKPFPIRQASSEGHFGSYP